MIRSTQVQKVGESPVSTAEVDEQIAAAQAELQRCEQQQHELEQTMISGDASGAKKIDQIVRLEARQRIERARVERLRGERREAQKRELVAAHRDRALALRERVTELHDLENSDEMTEAQRRFETLMRQRAQLRAAINNQQIGFRLALSDSAGGDSAMIAEVKAELAEIDATIQDILDTVFQQMPEWF